MAKNILVLCTGNSCRSQMAHGYLKAFLKDNANIYSAGIATHGLNPDAVEIMADDGIDISQHTSNHLDEYQDISWDYVLTVCDHAYEHCPIIVAPKAIRLHHNFYDPSTYTGTAEGKRQAFLKARTEIKTFIQSFVSDYLS